MNKAGRIISVNPARAIAGGEVIIDCEGFTINDSDHYGCYFDGKAARLVGASDNRVIAIVPDDFDTTDVEVFLENGSDRSDVYHIKVGKKIADNLHMVANPAVDPKDGSIILTRSGSRGQQLSVTLLRLEQDGYLNEMSAQVMNPTGVAFDKNGQLFVTARADGEVYRINGDNEAMPYASDLGVATGLAFDSENEMYVGDRNGIVYRVSGFGAAESFAVLEPSVAAYHMAFGGDDKLYVTAPGLSSHDAVYRVNKEGFDEVYYRGLGRPQGLALDQEGSLYVAACLGGRHGIVKIAPDKTAEIYLSGMNIVGLCFTADGDLVVATSDAAYQLPVGVKGILL